MPRFLLSSRLSVYAAPELRGFYFILSVYCASSVIPIELFGLELSFFLGFMILHRLKYMVTGNFGSARLGACTILRKD